MIYESSLPPLTLLRDGDDDGGKNSSILLATCELAAKSRDGIPRSASVQNVRGYVQLQRWNERDRSSGRAKTFAGQIFPLFLHPLYQLLHYSSQLNGKARRKGTRRGERSYTYTQV